MLNSANLRTESLQHLNFSSSFKIEFKTETGMIIFGHNGIGKTSIAKFLAKEKNDCFYLDVDYESKSTFVKNNKDYISINTEIDEIATLENELNNLKVHNTKDYFKTKGLTNAKSSRNISNSFDKLRKEINNWTKKDEIDFSISTTKKQIKEMKQLFNDHDSAILSNIDNIKSLQDSRKEFENYKKNLKLRLIDDVEKMYDLNKNDLKECPLCDSKIESLKDIIEIKKKKIQTLITTLNEDDVLKNYSKKEFDTMCKMVNDLDDKAIADYILTDGNADLVDVINKDIARYNELKNEIKLKKSAAKENYNAIKEMKENVEDYLSQRFTEFKDIELHEESHRVTINFNMPINQLSTGQLNLILFITELYKFEGSTKKVLIMDDPLSSFDLCNQYKIVFEIVDKVIKSKNNHNNKQYLVFTHNIELLNISRNQIQDKNIGYYVLDSINDELVISDKLSMNEAFFGLKTFHNIENPYIKLMINRELDPKAENNCVFHYHGEYSWKSLSNRDLLSKLDNDPTAFIKPYDFTKIIEHKILKLLALRVYVEYKLYQAIDDKSVLPKKFDQKTLGNKIKAYFNNSNLKSKITKNYPNLNKKVLMNKKVMLNQHAHFQGQIAPLNYAVNISLDDLQREINDIKRLFSDPSSQPSVA